MRCRLTDGAVDQDAGGVSNVVFTKVGLSLFDPCAEIRMKVAVVDLTDCPLCVMVLAMSLNEARNLADSLLAEIATIDGMAGSK